jgi:hypothetical protein
MPIIVYAICFYSKGFERIKPLNIKNTTSDDGSPGHYLGKAQTCDEVKPVNGNPNHPH